MRVFISQPMGGVPEDKILSERNRAIDNIKQKYGENVEILDTYFTDREPDGVNSGLWWLAKSLEFLSMAQLVYFVRGWDTKRGCRIEYTCAKEYGIPTIEET